MSALVDVCTVISNLPVARLATALVRPMGVDTQLLANVLASSALVQVPTSGVVGIQQESGGTAASVAAFQILTRHFARRRIEQTFVDVVAMRSGVVDFERLVATAPVRSQRVYTPTVGAQVW